MSFLLRDLMHEPATLVIVVASTLALVGTRTRFARWVLYASPVLLWLCTAPGQFDGRRHLTSKIDATAWVWISCVELRVLGAIALLLLAAPMGAAAGRLIGRDRGGLWGLALLTPFAGCLLASSTLLLRATRAIAVEQALDEERKLALLHAAIATSERIIAAGTIVSLLVSASLAFQLAAHREG
jgi:hypothetical protein